MKSRITVVQALDERDLLVRKISEQIEKACFVDLVRPKASVTLEKRVPREGFESQAQGAWQKIQALIERYNRLNAAIIASNASARIETSAGEMSVAFAVALRSRLRGAGPFGDMTDFEGILVRRMETAHREAQEKMRRKNEAARRAALQAQVRRGAAGRSAEGNRVPAVPEPLRMFDPLDVCKKAKALKEGREALLLELDTKIKISNATTWVEV